MTKINTSSQATLITFNLLLFLILIRTAWLADDAFITFRTIENFLDGEGLRWNISERVQSYTHPLWLLLISLASFFTGNIPLTTTIISIIISIIMVNLIFKNTSTEKFALILVFLLSSISFIDYSTSGLENSLTNILICLFVLEASKKTPRSQILLLIFSLTLLSRIDAALIIMPALALIIIKENKKKYLGYIIPALPAILWFAFSLIYYGTPLPNTAYAKLNTGIDTIALLEQGVEYYKINAQKDPSTIILIIYSCISIFLSNKTYIPKAILAGIILNLIYILKIGGDYMIGRFLSPSLIAAASLYAFNETQISNLKKYILTGLGLTILILNLHRLHYEFHNYNFSQSGIADERGFYYQSTNLKKIKNGINHPWAIKGTNTTDKVITACAVGMIGFYSDKNTHILDPLALTDLYLSQIKQAPGYWRIGHHERVIRDDYIKSIQENNNIMKNPQEKYSLGKIWEITKSDKLFSKSRALAILELNTGKISNLLSNRNKPEGKKRNCGEIGGGLSNAEWQ